MRQESGKVFDSTLFYVIIGIVAAVGVNAGLGAVLHTPMPVVAVESGSMEPTFYRGDILVLQGVPAGTLKVGDIIVFSPSEGATPVVHRIIKINGDGTFQTKGDANSGQFPFEKRIEEKQIYGKVILIVPYLGWVKLAFSDYVLPNIQWVVAACAIFAVLYVFGENIRKFLK